MGSKSNIEWTDATWNPVEGCTMAKGSETGGCLNCYAARNALRRPASGLAVMRPSGPRWTGKIGLVEKRLTQPLRWKTPKRIFVNSMSDLFHESLPDEAIDRVFAIMALCPQHTFQILSKRPERMLAWSGRFEGVMTAMRSMGVDVAAIRWPLPNAWLGVSVENQTAADARIPILLQTPAAIRFVSYEPALGPVDFTRIEFRRATWYDALEDHDGFGLLGAAHKKLDWVIVGGESGAGARSFDIAWARQTIQQCNEASIACFVKQLGAKPGQQRDTKGDWHPWLLIDRKGGDMSEWPEDLRIRQFPGSFDEGTALRQMHQIMGVEVGHT